MDLFRYYDPEQSTTYNGIKIYTEVFDMDPSLFLWWVSSESYASSEVAFSIVNLMNHKSK